MHSVDATEDNGRMGRLLNHSRTKPNVKTQIHEVDNKPILYFIASKDISINTELHYDYGERNAEVIKLHPWLKS